MKQALSAAIPIPTGEAAGLGEAKQCGVATERGQDDFQLVQGRRRRRLEPAMKALASRVHDSAEPGELLNPSEDSADFVLPQGVALQYQVAPQNDGGVTP